MITRRTVLSLALLLALAACATRGVTPRAMSDPPRPYNVVLIVAEDLSPRLGAYGDPLARTPRIDALAREGVRFANVFTAAPVCAPSRAALITGTYPQAIGAQHMRVTTARDERGAFEYLAVPPPEVKAFPELLRRAGYFTANQRKTDYQFGEPFTVWDVDAGKSLRFPWREAPKGRPFFAMINPVVTHESRLWPRPGHEPKTDASAVTVPPWLADTPVTRRDIAQQYDNVAALDSQVGEIVDALEKDGLLGDTIVIFTTDHGDGLPHAKRRPYDAGLHVPLVVRFPDATGGGTVRAELVSFVDLAPTILGLAGVESPPFILGRRFLGPSDSPPRQYVFASADRMDRVPGYWRAVRDARFEYLVNRMPARPLFEPLAFRDRMPSMQELWRLHAAGGLTPLQESQFTAPRPAEELYDLAADPDQTRSLASDSSYAADLARLRTALAGFESRVPDLSREPERVMAERMWPALVQPKTERPRGLFVLRPDGLRVSLSSPTPGASIGWRVTGDPADRWRLYVEPIPVASGTVIETKAVRYGWAESDVVEVTDSPRPSARP